MESFLSSTVYGFHPRHKEGGSRKLAQSNTFLVTWHLRGRFGVTKCIGSLHPNSFLSEYERVFVQNRMVEQIVGVSIHQFQEETSDAIQLSTQEHTSERIVNKS